MSTPDQPGEPQLTRKQLRELRKTGQLPVIDAATLEAVAAEAASTDAAPGAEGAVEAAREAVAAEESEPAAPATPAPVIPKAAQPAPVSTAPIPDAQVDHTSTPLTRRQARQQERIRTASVPVITPEIAAAAKETLAEEEDLEAAAAVAVDETVQPDEVEESVQVDEAPEVDEPVQVDETDDDMQALFRPADDAEDNGDAEEDPADAVWAPQEAVEAESAATVNPAFGASLLAAPSAPQSASIPPSFDQLIARGTTQTGSQSTPHALILPETPGSAPITGPITSTGEVMITGTFDLPEGLGSIGHAPGTADNKETDAVLVDHELPAHSSPTPIAASSAISTIKPAGEIIRPPAPEKGNKLMLTLAITAGALALALAGVLIVAIVTGVF